MTVKAALIWAQKKIAASSKSPALDAEVLLAFVLKTDRAGLFREPEQVLTVGQKRFYAGLIARRARFEPVAYLTGVKEFYSRPFAVSLHVLIPRPETETLIDAVIHDWRGAVKPVIIDVGTGSGAIAITLCKELPSAMVMATDLSAAALAQARKNAKRLQAKVKFFQANLLGNVLKKIAEPAIIAANLPYLTAAQMKKLPPDVRYEPRQALNGGVDGLKWYRALLTQIKKTPEKIRAVYLEADPRQMRPLKKIFRRVWPHASVEIIKDLAGKSRVFVMRMD
ncbi:MAG: prmC [Candidatus Magasanikbacteria bacterium]|nr:prmC [Candidatus Magasanikbacteria bacterium]